MPMYKFSAEELREIAADILLCSSEKIRVRARYCRKGEALKEDACKVYFVPSVPNPYSSLEQTSNGYNIKQYYTYSRFFMRGQKVTFQDNASFFFSECQSAADDFPYLEFTCS